MTTATRSSSLPLAAVIADLRGQLDDASNARERAVVKADIRWAEIDQAREVAGDPDAHALAAALARAGDQEAIAALRRADELGPPPVPQLVGGFHNAVRGNVGSALFTGSAVPVDLLDRLAAARRRGETFDSAWGEALAARGATSGLWLEVLRCTRPAWEAAFYRTNASAGYAVARWDADE